MSETFVQGVIISAIGMGLVIALATGVAPMLWGHPFLTSGHAEPQLPLLGGIPKLTIFADNDKAGIEAAQKCARRWVGIGVEVGIQAPKERGTDFADALALHKQGQVA